MTGEKALLYVCNDKINYLTERVNSANDVRLRTDLPDQESVLASSSVDRRCSGSHRSVRPPATDTAPLVRCWQSPQKPIG